MAGRALETVGLIRDSRHYDFGLSSMIISGAVAYAYEILDSIDERLVKAGGERLASLVELANLSAIVGNLFRNGISRASEGRFTPNAPHKYPDLLGVGPGCSDVEIKVALETNKPKGHLVKPGPHITVRYVLAQESGKYSRGRENRGNVVWIWEVRVGTLQESHFNFSNTEGDSGKTAVINAAGLSALKPVYCDQDRAPVAAESVVLNDFRRLSRVDGVA